MNIHILILLLTLPFYSFSQHSEDDFFERNDTNEVKMAKLNLSNLQGIWKKQDRRRYDLASDELYVTVRNYNHILIEGDKIWEFEYPCRMFSVKTFVIEDSVIKITSTKYLLNAEPPVPQIKLGSSGKCNYGVTADKNKLCFNDDNYEKDSLNISIINKLQRNYINENCVTGNWVLKTSYDSGYDGLGQVEILYPWQLPKTLSISNKNVNSYLANNLFYLKINGIKKPFTIDEIHVNEWHSKLILIPYKWYKEPDEDENYDTPFEGVRTSTIVYEFYENED